MLLCCCNVVVDYCNVVVDYCNVVVDCNWWLLLRYLILKLFRKGVVIRCHATFCYCRTKLHSQIDCWGMNNIYTTSSAYGADAFREDCWKFARFFYGRLWWNSLNLTYFLLNLPECLDLGGGVALSRCTMLYV
jgi:hypothetical protein